MDPIYIVILNYNSWQDTVECIEALLNSEFRNFQIILLDNNSPNDSEIRIKDYLKGKIKRDPQDSFFRNKLITRSNGLPFIYYKIEKELPGLEDLHNNHINNLNSDIIDKPILFLQTGENLGFAGGNNVALKILSRSILDDTVKIFLLNPDTFLDAHALGELSKIELQFFISSCMVKAYDKPHEQGFPGAFRIKRPFGVIQKNFAEIDYIYGGALFTNLATIRKIGLMPNNYFLYWEETDWCYGAKMEGVKLTICDKAVVYDKVGTSTGRGYLANYYFIRNGLIFYKKYFRRYMPSLLFYIGLRILDKIRKGEFNNAKAMIHGVRDYFKGKKGFTAIS